MNENKRLLTFFLVILGILLLIIIISVLNNGGSKSDIKFDCNAKSEEGNSNIGVVDMDGYQCLLKKGKSFAIILAQTTCSYCKQYKPYANKAAVKSKKPMYLINVNEITEDDFKTLSSTISYFDDSAHSSWGTPLTIFIGKDGKMTDYIESYTDDVSAITKKLDAMQ